MSKLKKLSEYQAERWSNFEELQKLGEPHPNGLECPKCGKELWDSSPMVVLASNPPQKNIHCPACNYRGYALR